MRAAGFVVIVLAVSALTQGCVIVQSQAPALRSASGTCGASVSVDGFVSETVDVNPGFGVASTHSSGYGSAGGQPFSYSGSSTTSVSGYSMSRRETGAMCGEVRNMLGDMGYAVMSPDPDLIVSGSYTGPGTDWRLWYADAAVDILTLTFCWNVRQKCGCDIRVYERRTGRMVKKVSATDSYQFTSFSLLPLYGHMFVPKMWPNNLYPHCLRRVNVKAVNELTQWLDMQHGVPGGTVASAAGQ